MVTKTMKWLAGKKGRIKINIMLGSSLYLLKGKIYEVMRRANRDFGGTQKQEMKVIEMHHMKFVTYKNNFTNTYPKFHSHEVNHNIYKLTDYFILGFPRKVMSPQKINADIFFLFLLH